MMERILWRDVPKYLPPTDAKTALLPPIAAYAEIWQPQWQDELGLSAQQRQKLLTIHAQAMADEKAETQRFQQLPPRKQTAQTLAWQGKPSPWRQQFEKDVCGRIEAVLTPQQLNTLKEHAFPGVVVGLLYNPLIRRQINFTAAQEEALHRIARQRGRDSSWCASKRPRNNGAC